MIVRRRVRMIAHNLRHSIILALILERNAEGKPWIKGKRMSYEKQIMQDTGCKFFFEIKRLTYTKKSDQRQLTR